MTIQKHIRSILQAAWHYVRRFKAFGRLEAWLLTSLKSKPERLRVTEEIDAIDARVPRPPSEALASTPGPDIQRPLKAVATPPQPMLKVHTEIDFHGLDNLEAYLEDATVTQETIQKWVAAGILSPQETRVAEQLIKLMRKSTLAPGKGDDRNTLQ